MAVTYGFYNAVNHDRVYDAIQMSSIFDGVIQDGIFSTIGTAMVVTAPGTDMYVNVGAGRAWFNHTWTLNDTELPIEVPEAEVVLSRIDALVLEVNSSVEVRANTIKFVKGTPSSTPVKPTLTHTTEVNQYALAYITVGPSVTAITQANVENAVGTDETPFITGLLQQLSIEEIVAQWEAQFEDFWHQFELTNLAEFEAWFQHMKDQLDSDAAGHLQNEVDALDARITVVEGDIVNIDTDIDVLENAFDISVFTVDTTGWTSDTTSQSGTTLYKKILALTGVNENVEMPIIDIAAVNTLPTVAEQEAYNLLKYIILDDETPCLELYASATPTTTFYIQVMGVVA